MAAYSCKFCKKSNDVETMYVFRANCGENLIPRAWASLQKKRFYDKVYAIKDEYAYTGRKYSFTDLYDFLQRMGYDEELDGATSLEHLYEAVCSMRYLCEKYYLCDIVREYVCPGCDIQENVNVTHTCALSRIPDGEAIDLYNGWLL
jgi:hypothetical protein